MCERPENEVLDKERQAQRAQMAVRCNLECFRFRIERGDSLLQP
jgi:hypothetical protein